jgi:hypothetical protein
MMAAFLSPSPPALSCKEKFTFLLHFWFVFLFFSSVCYFLFFKATPETRPATLCAAVPAEGQRLTPPLTLFLFRGTGRARAHNAEGVCLLSLPPPPSSFSVHSCALFTQETGLGWGTRWTNPSTPSIVGPSHRWQPMAARLQVAVAR